MLVRLTPASRSLAGLAASRQFVMLSADPLTSISIFASEAAGASSGVPVLNDRGRRALLEHGTPRRGDGSSVRLIDGSDHVGYEVCSGSPPLDVWVEATPVEGDAITDPFNLFGDGSDGAVTFDGTSAVLGIDPVEGVYALTRDLFLAAGIVAAGATLHTAGFRIFCSGTFTIEATGVVSNNGNAAVTSTAGAISAAGSTAQGTAGGAGGVGNNAGSNGTANATGFPGATGIGGAGGGDGTHAATTAGAWTALVATKGGARHALALSAGFCFGTSTASPFGGGSGGGGGSGDHADATAGAGGGGGGVVILAARALINNGAITATGGAGAAGTSAAHNAGGGGGGGGGVVATITGTRTGSGTATAAGGAGGAKAGASGVAGSAGAAGVVVQIAA